MPDSGGKTSGNPAGSIAFVPREDQALNLADNTTEGRNTLRKTVFVKNKLGLHLRPASQLVKLASQFEDFDIHLSKDGQQVNAKSIMGVIMLAAEQGSEILIEISGDSPQEALEAIEQLIASGFGED